MTWLTATGYLCHNWPRICSVCRNHKSVLSLYMTYHRNFSNGSTTDTTSIAGTENPSKHLSWSPVLGEVCVAWYGIFCVVFCKSLLVLLFWPLHWLSSSINCFWLPHCLVYVLVVHILSFPILVFWLVFVLTLEPNVVGVSGLSIIDWPFGFIYRVFMIFLDFYTYNK